MSATIRLLTSEEIKKHSEVLGWDTCVRKTCDGTHAYMASYLDRANRRHNDRLCVSHGQAFAAKHQLALPPVPKAPRVYAVRIHYPGQDPFIEEDQLSREAAGTIADAINRRYGLGRIATVVPRATATASTGGTS